MFLCAVTLPQLGIACCRIEIFGGEIRVGGNGVTVTPPPSASAVVATIVALVAAVVPVTKVIDDASKTVGQVTTNVVKESSIGLANVAREGGIAINNVATILRQAGKDTGDQLGRSTRDLEDAASGIYRYSINQITSTQTAVSHAEQRFRESKVIDAMFHLAVEPLQATDNNLVSALRKVSCCPPLVQ
jgi:hypothetical protein